MLYQSHLGILYRHRHGTHHTETGTGYASTESCIGCNRCITSCLGQCLGNNGFSYATCKSYLTQKKGDLTDTERAIIGKTPLIFGCDVCQEVCPHNKNLPTTPIVEFQSIEPVVDTSELKSLTNKEFKAKFGHRAFSWRGKKILIRNHEIIDSKKHKDRIGQ